MSKLKANIKKSQMYNEIPFLLSSINAIKKDKKIYICLRAHSQNKSFLTIMNLSVNVLIECTRIHTYLEFFVHMTMYSLIH